MSRHQDDWDFGQFFGGFGRGPKGFGFGGPGPKGGWKNWGGPGGRRRAPVFESGELKFIILRLLREKPRHGYDVIKALEERMWGCYTPSAGAVYPTLQMLEDQGYVRAAETDGKKVYHITPEGERFLDENRHTLDDIFERLRDTVRDFAGGAMGDLNRAFSRLATTTYKRAWRGGPGHPALTRITEILNRAAEEIERAWDAPDHPQSPTPV
jgi:DNA-binding PadR family transcriptional regulator